MVDTIKALATYLIALVIVVGGFLVLYLTRSDIAASDTRVIIAGFMGSAITFVFTRETQTQTGRQTAAATVAANNHNDGATS